MTDTPLLQLGQLLKETRRTLGFERAGALARRMRPEASSDSIARLGGRIRNLEEAAIGDRCLVEEMARTLEIPAGKFEPFIDEERRLRAGREAQRQETERLFARAFADVFRGTFQYKQALQQLDPWVPYPQSSTCFSFGERKAPLPIGALFVLWERSREFTAICPHCQTGLALGYSFGGLLAIGGICRCCVECGEASLTRYQGFVPVQRIIEPLLADTPFFVNGFRFGGAFSGERRPLVEALRGLGWTVDVPEEWLDEERRSAITFGLGGKSKARFFLG